MWHFSCRDLLWSRKLCQSPIGTFYTILKVELLYFSWGYIGQIRSFPKFFGLHLAIWLCSELRYVFRHRKWRIRQWKYRIEFWRYHHNSFCRSSQILVATIKWSRIFDFPFLRYIFSIFSYNGFRTTFWTIFWPLLGVPKILRAKNQKSGFIGL